jgi:erythromycin esterase
MKFLYLLFTLFLFVPSLLAQDFLNLGFEYNVYNGQPRKWVIEGEGEYYYAKIDSTTDAHEGKKSLNLELKNGEAYVFLSLPQSLVKGKTVSISGFLKSKKFDSLQVLLGFRDPQGGKPSMVPLQEPKNNEWQALENQTSISSDFKSDKLLVALVVIGSGKISFDDVTIKVDGNEIGNASPDFKEPTQKEINDLNNSVIPITLEQKSELKDLESLDKVIGNSKIVALGENSHGSAPIYKLKLRLVQYLVERKGYTLFALESPAVEADAINEYVTKNIGSKDQVINNLVYPSWRTQEMLDVIEWINKYNQKAKIKVQFKGFDMQDGAESLNKLREFASTYDKNLVSKLDTVSTLTKLKKNEIQDVYRKIEDVEKYLTTKSTKDYAGISNEKLTQAKRYSVILRQSYGLKLRIKSRDQYMAENIQWLLLNDAQGERMIVSADNSHVTKATGKMGDFLKTMFANDYLTVGFTFNTGTYAAYGEKRYYDVHPSYVGTYEYLFSKSKFQNYMVDLRHPKMASLVSASKGFRSIGSRPQETTQFAETFLHNNFDVIAYIEKSKHTEMK